MSQGHKPRVPVPESQGPSLSLRSQVLGSQVSGSRVSDYALKICMVKFNVSVLNRVKIMGFFVNTKKIHKHSIIFKKTVVKNQNSHYFAKMFFFHGLHGFILNWTYLNFLDFYEKNPCWKKNVPINYFNKQQKPWIFLEIFQKKKQKIKSHLNRSRLLKTYNFLRRPTLVSHIFLNLAPPPQLVYCYYGPEKAIS